jgi:hypothetical protein
MVLSLAQQPLLIGAWIGLIHAFDADHITTLGNLAVRGRPRSIFGYAARWACGHAVAIGAFGALAVGVGMLWVASLSQFAEALVASLLIALGLNTLWSNWRQRGPMPAAGEAGRREHSAGLLMGLLHGGAGSATVLAIVPLAGMESAFAAFGFLFTFSIGVAAGALMFALLFSVVLVRTARGGNTLRLAFTSLVGAAAMLVGGSMLLGTLHAG